MRNVAGLEAAGPCCFREWREGIRTEMAAGLSWWAAVDPASDPQLPGLLRTFRDRAEILPLLTDTKRHDISLQDPLFVAMHPGEEITDWFLTRAQYSAAGVLYVVQEGMEERLFEHLRHLIETPRLNGGTGRFRFCDPRVLHAIGSFPDSDCSRLVVGPARRVHAWDPGRAEAVALHQGVPEIFAEPSSKPLPRELLEFIARRNAPYAVLDEITKTPMGARLGDLPLPDAFFIVENVCSSLEALSIFGMDDLVMGVGYCLLAGRNIFSEAPVMEWMNARGRTGSLQERLVGIPGEVLRG